MTEPLQHSEFAFWSCKNVVIDGGHAQFNNNNYHICEREIRVPRGNRNLWSINVKCTI